MEKTFPTNGNAFPASELPATEDGGDDPQPELKPQPESQAEPGPSGPRRAAFDRLASFRATYVALFVFLLLDIFTVRGTEWLLTRHFEQVVEQATRITTFDAPVAVQIQNAIEATVRDSAWVTVGGVRVTVMVLGRDGVTPIYLGGHIVPPPPGMGPDQIAREAERLLPASSSVQVSVPLDSLLANGILVAYGAVLVQVLFLINRRLARGESERLAHAAEERDRAAGRAEEIGRELEHVRQRLLEVEPAEREQGEEIRALQTEREALLEKLGALAQREEELLRGAARAHELDQERQALEDLLEEASSDLQAKDAELEDLQSRLRRAAKSAGKAAGGRGREAEAIGRRLRTLYKNLEIDDRAVNDLAALGDESLKLRAEEAIKRLSDESENVGIRRKVGGLPPYLSIFELGFAGKGRIYYARGRQRRFRVLLVGAKNTQKPDLEYLSRLPRSEFS